MAVDSDGNAYVSINGQGRILVLNLGGNPFANVLVSRREEGMHLAVTNLKRKPGTDEAYTTVSGNGGGWLYRFKGPARAVTLFGDRQ